MKILNDEKYHSKFTERLKNPIRKKLWKPLNEFTAWNETKSGLCNSMLNPLFYASISKPDKSNCVYIICRSLCLYFGTVHHIFPQKNVIANAWPSDTNYLAKDKALMSNIWLIGKMCQNGTRNSRNQYFWLNKGISTLNWDELKLWKSIFVEYLYLRICPD